MQVHIDQSFKSLIAKNFGPKYIPEKKSKKDHGHVLQNLN